MIAKGLDLLAARNPAETVAARLAEIRAAMLRESSVLREANFSVIGCEDLARLFRLYDERFFGGWLTAAVAEEAEGPLVFRLSPTMTRAGGKTIQHRRIARDGTRRVRYEIAIASRLLFMTFGDIQRPVVVCGLTCADRLEALQRLMEHEIVHLAELLAWGESSCATGRFKMFAANLFGHAGVRHDLVTPHERARAQHGIGVGSRVEFVFEGARLVGRINRIHRRATVLVEAADGTRYTDGKSYRKYYIPLPLLRPAADGA